MRQGCLFSALSFNTVLKTLASAITQEKERAFRQKGRGPRWHDCLCWGKQDHRINDTHPKINCIFLSYNENVDTKIKNIIPFTITKPNEILFVNLIKPM